MQGKIHRLARTIVFCTIPLIALILHPLFNNPFNILKMSVLVIAATFGLLCLLNPKFIILNSKNVKILIPPTLFIIIMSCLSLVSENKYIALIGRYENSSGALKYLCLFVIFLLTVFSFRTVDAIMLLNLLGTLGAFISIYGFFQYLGIDFISYSETDYPIITTFGNSNFTSGFLGISSISLLWNIIKSKNKFIKIGLILLIIFKIYVMFLSQSSQGLFILIFGIVSIVGLIVFKSFHKLKVAYTTLTIFTFIFISLGLLQIGPLSRLVYQPSVTFRGDYFRAAWNMFKSNIFVGVGIDHYAANYRGYRDLNAALRINSNTVAGNTHNFFLELLATGGIFLFLAYCLFLLTILLSIKNGFKRLVGSESLVFFILTSCWFGFQAYTLISPVIAPIETIGWVLAGALIALELNKENKPKATFTSTPQQKMGSKNLFAGSLGKVIVFTLLVLDAIFLIPTWQAEFNLKLAKDIRNSIGFENNLALIEKLARSITEKNDFESKYKVEKAKLLYSINQKESARNILQSVINSNPKNYDAYIYLSQIFENLNMYEKSIDIRLKMTSLDKYDTDNWLNLAKNFAEVERYGEIKEIINLAKEKNFTLIIEDLTELLPSS